MVYDAAVSAKKNEFLEQFTFVLKKQNLEGKKMTYGSLGLEK